MSDFKLEYRSGMEWKVRYEDDMPVEGYIEDMVARVEKMEEATSRADKAPGALDGQIEEAQAASKDIQGRSDQEKLEKDKEVGHER